MKHYLKPEVVVYESEVQSPLMETSTIPQGDNNNPPDAPRRRGSWGNLWSDGTEE